jgi:hypothetical protein
VPSRDPGRHPIPSAEQSVAHDQAAPRAFSQCRTHAEQRAITLDREGDGWRRLRGSKLIYVRLEADDSARLEMPHCCSRCSRLALSLGVAERIFALPDGLVGYSSADYDAIAQLRW